MTRVAVIGGGLAGLAAAMRLCEADCEVTLIETRKKLGGRATSFVDPRTDETFDNCQHVLMGCCTNLIDLYERLGVSEKIEWHDTLYWTRGGGEIDAMHAGVLPAPLHFSGSFARMKLFTSSEKRAIARAMWRMIRLGAKGRYEWTSRAFIEFLNETKQPERIIREFWNTIIVSACNLPVERVGTSYAIQVFQQGFLADKWSYLMGVPSVPLRELYDPAVERIGAAGGRIMLGTSAQSIGFDGSRVKSVVTSDGVIEASAVVATVPHDRLDKLISDSMRSADPRLQHLDEITVSPILGVHLRFDQPIMDLPHLILMNHGVQWLFNKGVDDEQGTQHIHAVLSAADEWMALSEEEIVDRVLKDMRDVLPAMNGIEPISVRAVKEKRATFAAVPNVDRLRPPAAPGAVGLGGGGIANLYLAGDWCDTGWPATMEGAVRSGYAAAAAIIGDGEKVADIPPATLAALLGLR